MDHFNDIMMSNCWENNTGATSTHQYGHSDSRYFPLAETGSAPNPSARVHPTNQQADHQYMYQYQQQQYNSVVPPPPGLYTPNQYFYAQDKAYKTGAPPGFRSHNFQQFEGQDYTMNGKNTTENDGWSTRRQHNASDVENSGDKSAASKGGSGWINNTGQAGGRNNHHQQQQQKWSLSFIPTMVYQSSGEATNSTAASPSSPSSPSSTNAFLNGDSSIISWKKTSSNSDTVMGSSRVVNGIVNATVHPPKQQHQFQQQQQQHQFQQQQQQQQQQHQFQQQQQQQQQQHQFQQQQQQPGSVVGNTYRRTMKANNGMDRLYRHPRQYNWNSHNSHPQQQPQQQQQQNSNSTQPGLRGKNAKLEGRKKLLAEAASLLTGGGATASSATAAPANAAMSQASSTSVSTAQPTGGSNNYSNYTKQNNYANRKESLSNTWRNSQQESGGGGGYHMKRGDNNTRSNNGGNNNCANNSGVNNNSHQHQVSAINWRDRDQRHQNKPQQDSVSQRERLIEQLSRGSLECLVCCERIRQLDRVWSCSNCHHVLHLKCIVKWASTSKAENGWRCPACQNVTLEVPNLYRCMCGKVTEPQWVRGETPHCCGQMCAKTNGCVHQCTLLCHPGPCPQCSATVDRECGCGRTKQVVMCSSNVVISCDSLCLKKLNCGRHLCQSKCHHGACTPCQQLLQQECYCGAKSRSVECGGDGDSGGDDWRYSCGGRCPNKLKCGQHSCTRLCHSDDCAECPLQPTSVTTCPCGTTAVPPSTRTSCLDPVPTCSATCAKRLNCGQPGNRHKCKAICHEGECPPCELTTSVMCRCGAIEKQIACQEITSKVDDTTCQKKCSKKRSCGKHKCNQLCCIEADHVCPLPCNKTLTCGRHKCQSLCHKGHCQPCTHASFEELRCECGKSVILPPVACGTRVPECKSPCPRSHDCSHPPLHTCHSAQHCPPCTVLTTKHCYGGHETRKTVPCHIAEYSCGRRCGKLLGCGHTCQRACHGGACLESDRGCTQPCPVPRTVCAHPCAAPCHSTTPPGTGVQCPSTGPCLAKVRVTCQCGRRTTTRTCQDNSSEYQRIATSLLASKMADVQLGLSVDTDIKCASKMSLKTLECNDECKLYERNLRLAIGLQIANPDLTSKLNPPKYTDTMKSWAKKDSRFCQMVHDKLTQLVQLAKESKQKSRSYSFDPMNRDKRQFVHEYCKHFGCESMAYDTEPKRNIVATAYRDKCWLPSYSLLEVVQRENGQRKVPIPSMKKDSVKDVQMKPLQKANQMSTIVGTSSATMLTLMPSGSGAVGGCSSVGMRQQQEGNVAVSKSPPPPAIDYFDYTN